MRDIDVRRSLCEEVTRRHQGDADTVIVNELGLCQGAARVDVAVINGFIHGFEIKSERDTLDRLPHQSDVYSRALDLATMVTAKKHLSKIRLIVPRWWGLVVAENADNCIVLRELRTAKKNPSVDAFAQAQLLWRDEALHELERRALAHGMRAKTRKALWEKLARHVDREEIGSIVRFHLKRRLRLRAVEQPASSDDWYPPSSMS